MANKKLYLSYSSIKVFLTCKKRFKLKYIDKIAAFQPISNKYISFGESIHSTLAQFNFLTDDNYRTLDNLHKLLRLNWIRKGYETLEEERSFGLKGLELLSNYYREPKDKGKRIIVEEMIKKDLNNGIILCGKLDAAYRRYDDLVEVLDYKTGLNIEPIDGLQLAIYLLLASEKLDHNPQVVSNYYLTHNEKQELLINDDYINQSYRLISDTCDLINNESIYPCSPTPYCERNCEYYKDCDEAKDNNNIIINELEASKFKQRLETIF